MSGCVHMNARDVCGSCAPVKYKALLIAFDALAAERIELEALREENERLKAKLEKVVEALSRMLDAWDRAEGNRGCYSCAEVHDCRCEMDRKISDVCTCGRVELDSAAEMARAALAAAKGEWAVTTEDEFAAKSPLHAALLDAEKRVIDLDEENARLKEWKAAVIGTLNPLRPGDSVELWGRYLADPAVVVSGLETIRRERDEARAKLAKVAEACVLHGGSTDISHDCADEIRARIQALTRERDEALSFLRKAAHADAEIVSTSRLTELQIANYRAAGMMYVEPTDGLRLGWVVRQSDRFKACSESLHARAEAAEAQISELEEEIERLRFYMTPGQKDDHGHIMSEYRKRIAAEAKLAKVVELHQRGVNPQGQEFCTHCVRIGWPCATLAAAKGE